MRNPIGEYIVLYKILQVLAREKISLSDKKMQIWFSKINLDIYRN